jgi:hypothetical protein
MSEFEQQLLREVEDRLDAVRQEVVPATWERRREAASGLFEAIHSAWWRRHASVPGAHVADIGVPAPSVRRITITRSEPSGSGGLPSPRHSLSEKRIAFLKNYLKGEVDRQADAASTRPVARASRRRVISAPPVPAPARPIGLLHALSKLPSQQALDRGDLGVAGLWEIGGLLADIFLGTHSARTPPPPSLPPVVLSRRPRRKG